MIFKKTCIIFAILKHLIPRWGRSDSPGIVCFGYFKNGFITSQLNLRPFTCNRGLPVACVWSFFIKNVIVWYQYALQDVVLINSAVS